MKKTFALILALALLLSLLAACGNNEQSGSTPTPTTAQPSKTPEDNTQNDSVDEKWDGQNLPITDEPSKFSIWFGRVFNSSSGINSWAESDVFKELNKRTNVTIETIHPPGSSSTANVEQFNLIVVSGDYPDVFAGGTWNGGYDKYIDDGIIVDLTDVLDKYGPDILFNMNKSEVLRRSCITDTGNMPMIPLVQYQTVTGPTAGLCVRGDWLEEQGFTTDDIATYDGLFDVLGTLKTAYGLTHPFGFASIAQVFSGNVSRVYTYGFNAAPSFIYDAEGKMSFGPVQQQYRDFLVTYNSFVKAGLITTDIDGLARNDIEAKWYNDEIAFGFGMAYYLGNTAYQKGVVTNPDFKIVGVDEPKFYEGIELHTGEYHQYNADNFTYNNNYVVTTACTNPDVVVKWFNYCFTEDGILLTNYGFEGDTFNFVDGLPIWTDKISNNPDMPSLEATQQRYLWHFPPFTDFDKELRTYPDELQKEAVATWQSSTDHAWCLPLNYTFTSDESAEYSSIYNDIATYVLESTSRFLAGIEDPTDDGQWNAYVAQIQSMRIERVLELVNDACERCLNR